MKTLYFCRHGLSQFGKQGLWAGSSDTPLAPEGREQAAEAGRGAKQLHIDRIVSSPLARAYDTAQIIATTISYPVPDIKISPLVVERNFGELEGTTWDPDLDMEHIASVEPAADVLERARQALEYIRSLEADTILIVSHGTFGRALRHIINPEIPFRGSERFKNAEIVKLI